MAEIKNILLFLTDDHAEWALGCSGNREIRTPNLDYLARTGVQMTGAFTPTPVCSAARASLLTGRLASQHGVHDYLASTDKNINSQKWMADEISLADLLAGAGYQTAQVGKWHLGKDEFPQAGFEYWFSLGRDYPIHHGGEHRYSLQGERMVLEGRKAQIITDFSLRFLRERDPERPFFLSINHVSPHSPWKDHPERLVSAYRGCSFEDVPRDEAYPFGRQNLESTEPTRLNRSEALAQYYAAVTQVDDSVGRVLDELDALGLRENTLIIYTSDHGMNCSHHGIWGKGNGTLPLNMVEESIRVPLLFNHPELFANQRRGEFVDHLDLFQTILDFAGVRCPDDRSYPGHSFLPMLQNRGLPDWRQVQHCEYGNLRMIRTRRHKLLRRYPAGPCELFDLQQDPREMVNLYDDPGHQQLVEALTAKMERYFEKYQDPEKSGLRVWELPQHNFTEAWR